MFTIFLFVANMVYLMVAYGGSITSVPLNQLLLWLFVGVCALFDSAVTRVEKAIKDAK